MSDHIDSSENSNVYSNSNYDDDEPNIVDVLISIANGLDINSYLADGDTPLILAVEKGLTEIVKSLIRIGADVNKTAAFYGKTPLKAAANEGHTEIVKLLIQNGANVNAVGIADTTSLMTAATYGYTEIVKILIQNGADVNKAATDGSTSLSQATKNSHAEIVRLLLLNGADVNKEEAGETPLILAARHIAKNNGILPLPIVEAQRRENAEIVKLLIQNGADINKANRSGETPLIVAAYNDNTEAVKLLIQAGADVNKSDSRDYISLSNAEQKTQLLSKGTYTDGIRKPLPYLPPDIKRHIAKGIAYGTCKYCKTPLSVAALKNNIDIVNLLLSHGVNIMVHLYDDVRARAEAGRYTPKINAAILQHIEEATKRRPMHGGFRNTCRKLRRTKRRIMGRSRKTRVSRS